MDDRICAGYVQQGNNSTLAVLPSLGYAVDDIRRFYSRQLFGCEGNISHGKIAEQIYSCGGQSNNNSNIETMHKVELKSKLFYDLG